MGDAVSQLPCCAGQCGDEATQQSVDQTPPGAWIVTLDRSNQEKLGLDVEHRGKEGNSIPVSGITGGLAEKWNEMHPPEKQIQSGDHVIEVNGVKGDLKGMMQRFQMDQILKLTLHRGPSKTDEAAAAGSTSPRANTSPRAESSSGACGLAGAQAVPPTPPEAHRQPPENPPPPSSNNNSSGVSNVNLDNLMAMGFTEANAQEALARSGGDLDAAIAALAGDAPSPQGGALPGGGQDDALALLLGMGFEEVQAREALASCGGNAEIAIEMLSGGGGDMPPGGGGGGGGEEKAAKIAQLTAMGFTEEQARNALDGASGNVERATNILLGG